MLIKEHVSLSVSIHEGERETETYLEVRYPVENIQVINSVFKATSPFTRNLTQFTLLILCATRVYHHMQKKLEYLVLTLMLPHYLDLRFQSMKCLYLCLKIT